jgi:ectoine hydroxylase-related dioxygenase (phytanoyl-CoA dioxygenase family)
MALNTVPLRDVTDEDRAAYERDGAVCLREVFDPEWLDTLMPMARRITIEEEDVGLLPSAPGRYMSRIIPEFRRFIFDSPMAEAAAKAIGSKTARFFFEEIFAKPAHSDSKTIWHCDRMGWPVAGQMVPSLWIPLHDVKAENALEVIAGSHKQDVKYWLFSPNARKMVKPDDRAAHPDEAKLRADPKNKFLQWELKKGDMLIVHPWALHYSSGNTADDWRIAISARIFGDDIVWDPRPDCVNLAGVSFDEMVEGNPPAGPLFPMLWSEDGQRDGDDEFPRGFATTWKAQRRNTVNEDELFADMLKKAG